jgi:two-component sensor histidine kinase
LRTSDGATDEATYSVQQVTDEHDLRRELERQKRNFDLAMKASDMGTWRYTLADNTVVFDENAQRLYGVTEARFLHTEEGVKSMIHPDAGYSPRHRLADPAGCALPSAREALDRRIRSMAQAHDLLTSHAWTGTDLTDILMRTLEAFPQAQVKMSGAAINVSPKHTLALSLALHELATNATKYGALSCPDGHVSVLWAVRDKMLHLDCEESGGPPVAPPDRKGFGSRLLGELVVHDLGGAVKLSYDASGVRCSIAAAL